MCLCISKSLHIVADFITPLHEYASLFTYSLIGGHLDCFQVLAIMSKASINKFYKIFVHVYFNLGEVR